MFLRYLLLAGLLFFSVHTVMAQDAKAGKSKAQVCFACHGENGHSIGPEYPHLAGQTARYIYIQLKDYKEGNRKNELMSPMAANLSRQDMFDIAAYFASIPLVPSEFKADPERVRKGKAKSDETLCTMCHLGGFAGQNEIPRVAGQRYEYVVKQLHDFKTYKRTNDAGNMASVAKTLSDDDIVNIGHYLASLK